MKYLHWFKNNINLVSFVIGIGFIAFGRAEEGRLIISQGASQ